MQFFIGPGNFTVKTRSICEDNSQFSVNIKQGKREVAKYIINVSELPPKDNIAVYNHDLAGAVAFHRYQSENCSN